MVLDLNMIMSMKRVRDREEEEEADQNAKSLANCLMLLSSGNGGGALEPVSDGSFATARVFECKTCNRQFQSFQALGGHRASHKKLRLAGENSGELRTSPAKPKTHDCPVCGLEFAIGQALGGHMRRHRKAAVNDENHLPPPSPPKPGLSLSPPGHHIPVIKRSNSIRVFSLDLNLTPLENSFLLFGKLAPSAVE